MFCQNRNFGRKPWTIVRRFDQISFRSHNSSLEGATKLKFAPFCSSSGALSDGIIVCRNRFNQFFGRTHETSRRLDCIPVAAPVGGPVAAAVAAVLRVAPAVLRVAVPVAAGQVIRRTSAAVTMETVTMPPHRAGRRQVADFGCSVCVCVCVLNLYL